MTQDQKVTLIYLHRRAAETAEALRIAKASGSSLLRFEELHADWVAAESELVVFREDLYENLLQRRSLDAVPRRTALDDAAGDSVEC